MHPYDPCFDSKVPAPPTASHKSYGDGKERNLRRAEAVGHVRIKHQRSEARVAAPLQVSIGWRAGIITDSSTHNCKDVIWR
jgi:hypothetical protein